VNDDQDWNRVRLEDGVDDVVQQLGEFRHQPVGQVQDLEHAHHHRRAFAHGVDVKKPAHAGLGGGRQK
jgi:hypothetical protein